MDDAELDNLLGEAGPRLDLAADEAAIALLQALPHREQQRNHRRRTAVLIALPAGALALAAAGTWQAAQLQMPPFQGTEPGLVRIYEPVNFTYDDVRGTHECQLFLEGTRLDEQQIAALRAVAKDPDVARAISIASERDANPTSAPPPGLGDHVSQVVWQAVHQALPEVKRGLEGEPDQPTYTGYATYCNR